MPDKVPRQTHKVIHHKRIGRPAGQREQKIDLKHRDTGRQAHEHGGSDAGRTAVLAPVRADIIAWLAFWILRLSGGA